MDKNSSVAVILGSAYQHSLPHELDLEQATVETKWGEQQVYTTKKSGKSRAYVIFRHGLPHKLLPNQINYRAQAQALQQLGCGALLVTSSVGVMDASLPLFKPMLLSDLIMLDNRLPNGEACTMFAEPDANHGHLVLNEGLFSKALNRQLRKIGEGDVITSNNQIVFAYAGGPRTKTKAENRIWPQLGAQVNSMTLAPEVILANELEIPCTGLVIGHKYSVPDIDNPESGQALADTLDSSRAAMESIIKKFLEQGQPVSFGNQIYRFDE